MSAGILYIVATPIGNIDDISARAIQILGAVDVIAAEDTRHSKQLLNRLGISNKLVAYHDHNDDYVSSKFIDSLAAGQSIALISDAGTPLISDPGYKLVKLARESGVSVIPIPGASAITAALSVAGLATDRFCFEGFLPAKTAAREQRLTQLSKESRTLVFYEAPHRIVAALESFVKVFGEDRLVFLGREITKKFESHFYGSVAEAAEWLNSDSDNQRGEFVIVLSGDESADAIAEDQAEAFRIAQLLESEMSLKRAVALASEITGVRKNQLYQAMLARKSQL
ncbi:MAG: 16S rRNA (cytidine1402-2'-O)-methyltransferase [Pseudohongiellaceae bacterium]|jgi:16S rRNA (cytidine1402-2'-O)-methyltransferase